MFAFIVRRMAALVILLLVVSFVTFALFQIGPADPAAAACGQERRSCNGLSDAARYQPESAALLCG